MLLSFVAIRTMHLVLSSSKKREESSPTPEANLSISVSAGLWAKTLESSPQAVKKAKEEGN